jgi:hypothetical protein
MRWVRERGAFTILDIASLERDWGGLLAAMFAAGKEVKGRELAEEGTGDLLLVSDDLLLSLAAVWPLSAMTLLSIEYRRRSMVSLLAL